MRPIAIIRRVVRRRPRASQRRDCEQRQRHEPEEQCEVLQELRQVLRGLELVGLKHLDLTRVGGQASGEGAEDCDLVSELEDEWLEIEHDGPVCLC